MMQRPYFSICIPSYNRAASVKRLLLSIDSQTFRDFEVIITDDSKDEAVAQLLQELKLTFPVVYQKNNPPAGSPSNWNLAIEKSTGQWIKIMHDDDFFSGENSLYEFYMASKRHKKDFICSGFNEINYETQQSRTYVISKIEEKMLRYSPLCLFKKNFIGHPSTTLLKNNRKEWFDPLLKWVVDFEFYIRVLKEKKGIAIIKKPLINIGISDTQITKKVFRKIEIEIPENIYLLNKIGIKNLKNLFVTDYYWRLFRNLKIENVESLKFYIPLENLPRQLKSIISFQNKIGMDKISKNRYISKIMTLYFYLRHVLL
ncbi:MAG: glycosyltransferase family 2 protein [Ferruginibacter sp.]|nr:glycosyltransferase family 2 protein [Ferruginibacter sp.]